MQRLELGLRRFASLLFRSLGKDQPIDPAIPFPFIVRQLARRASWMARGVCRLRTRTFVGRRVRIVGVRQLSCGPWSTLEDDVIVVATGELGVTLGDGCRLGRGTAMVVTSHLGSLGRGIVIGSRSALGEGCYVGGGGGVAIGDDVLIGQYCSFHSENHVFERAEVRIRMQGTTRLGIVVGDDVWIGAKATILDGAHISSHSVVAAGAVVSGYHPPNSLIAGVPARVIRSI